jgi:Tol biopolymer transport system component
MKKLMLLGGLGLAYLGGYAQAPSSIPVSPTIQLSDTARVFGQGVISNGDFVYDAAFTPDNKTVFFNIATIGFAYSAILYSTKIADKWSKPQAVSFTGIYRDNDPFISADGKRLYFSSDRPLPGKPFVDEQLTYFYVELQGNKIVSEPVPFNLPLPNGQSPSYLSFANNGNAYFFLREGRDADIYMCEFKNGQYLPPVSLPFNSKDFYDIDPMIARDESFIVFLSVNRKGYGRNDIWVSFKNGQNWSEPVNMGNKVNSSAQEGFPYLSNDGKTLYFDSVREKADRPKSKLTTKAIMDLMHSTKNEMRHIYEISIADLKPPAN